SIICSPMTSLKTSIKTITYLSDIGCLEIQGASLEKANGAINKMAEVIRFRLNIISLYGAKKELTHRIQTVLNATIIKVL
ncbi:hypothetical protein ACRWF7_20465, partial [Escherichia coli]